MKRIMLIVGTLTIIAFAGFYGLAASSKNGQALGIVDGRLSPCPSSPNCVSSEVDTQDDKKVSSFPLSAWPKLPAVVSSLGGTIRTQEDSYIAATFRTPLMGFVDDVEFRRADDVVHVRSASRVGHSDFGANGKRVERIRSKLTPGQ
ncbi:MAG: DUF1499 domain-containing protein [Pseudomonadota bacterium]